MKNLNIWVFLEFMGVLGIIGGFWGLMGVFGGKVKKGKTPTPKISRAIPPK